jgi:Big-like domain-containing protein/calcineurin-like phosphoesterase family protein
MKSMKLRVICVLVGMGLSMLLSVGFWGSGVSVSAQTATDPVMVGAGDIATPISTADTATAELIKNMPDATVFTAGDNAYPDGTASDFNNNYHPTWGQFKERTKPVPGNHEYHTPGASGYFGYFGAAADDPSKGYYSYNLGEWHVVALNSECEHVGGCGATSPMVRWLEQDLAAYPATCTLAYFHHPLFSSGFHGNQSEMRPTWDVLYAAGADVVVSSHDHDYERFAPQRPDGTLDTSQGIREFVVGTGGADLRAFGFIQPNSEVRNSDTHGVLKLTLHPSSYDWQFVPVAGKTFTDSGTGNCHGGSEPPPPDITAPTVTVTVPTANATGVAPTANVTATFSEEMMASTINTKTFKLFKKGSITKLGATVSYNASTDTATLDPTNSLRRGVTYKAVVTTGAQDLAGNSLDQNSTTTSLQKMVWFFTVSS